MKKLILLPFLLIAFMTCPLHVFARNSSPKNLDYISIGMSKNEVIRRMGSSGIARGAILNKYGQTIEVREYKIEHDKGAQRIFGEAIFTVVTLGFGASTLFSDGDIDIYRLFFYNGFLVRWGQAGDWEEEQRVIYDINFNVSYR